MMISTEAVQKVEKIAAAVYQKIGASNIQKNIRQTVRFAISQPQADIILDGKPVRATAVDIATVFSPEGHYWKFVDEHYRIRTAESIQALSIVVIGDDVILCKSSYDAITGPVQGEEQFINSKYWTTSLDLLTEQYIC